MKAKSYRLEYKKDGKTLWCIVKDELTWKVLDADSHKWIDLCLFTGKINLKALCLLFGAEFVSAEEIN